MSTVPQVSKAEHLSFDVPTLPLFIHERLARQAAIAPKSRGAKKASKPQARQGEAAWFGGAKLEHKVRGSLCAMLGGKRWA